VRPFSIAVSDDVLDHLSRRLEATRWPDEPPRAGWEQGAPVSHVQALVERWRDGFDWRSCEAVLNAFSQYTAPVSGIDLHFIAEGASGPPVVLLHGWPSSVWEFHELVPLLRDSAQVVVPSLPGYGFSFAPGQRRFGIVDCADAIHSLMTDVLGHSRYYVVGGDWGSSTAVRMAHAYPHAVQALHLYMMPLRRPQTWPESERESRAALEHWQREEGGYGAIQGTRPQTLAYGLSDSPAGLCGWLAEKFEIWTDASLDPDDVLAMVTLYWVTGTIGASFWPYYARLHGEWVLDEVAAAGGRIAAPLTYLDFPKELVHVPRTVVETVFDIERWEAPARGGHFPALEQTAVLADSVQRFLASVPSGNP
jgi:pimeloyl-ACP methyl ester carboxylesterase